MELGKTDHKWNRKPFYDEVAKDYGHKCKQCRRTLRYYRRGLTASMCRNLIQLYWLTKRKNKDAFHVRQFEKEGGRGEFGVLSTWGLVIEAPDQGSGMWRLTGFGAQFVKNKAKVPLYVIMKWGSEVLGYAGHMVKIKDCVEHGGRFEYKKLMR